MNAHGWRTAVIDSPAELSLRDGTLAIRGERETEIPLSQLETLVIADERCTVSGKLLNALSAGGISVLFCDARRNPSCELAAFGVSNESAGKIMEQAAWNVTDLDRVWGMLVRAKISSQIKLLQTLQKEVPPGMEQAALSVAPGDPDNREGQAARLYFPALFGEHFLRHTDDNINAALNYGYTILCSSVSRCVASHGYHTALGIHHRGKTNRFNLSCDIMEPFRPFVDRIVWENADRPLDWPYKLELIGLLQVPCTLGKRRMKLRSAIELFTLDVFKYINKPGHCLKEIRFD